MRVVHEFCVARYLVECAGLAFGGEEESPVVAVGGLHEGREGEG